MKNLQLNKKEKLLLIIGGLIAFIGGGMLNTYTVEEVIDEPPVQYKTWSVPIEGGIDWSKELE